MTPKLRRFDNEDLARLKEAAPIAEVAAGYTELTPVGDDLTGRCPLHEDDTPSFSVTPAKAVFHCFGCGQGGDVIALVRAAEHLDFPSAVKTLAERFNVPIQDQTDEDATAHADYLAVMARATGFYARALTDAGPESTPASFLASRSISPEIAARYQLGYATERAKDELTKAAIAAGIPRDDLIAASLARNGKSGLTDYFRNRLIFPICDHRGAVIGFGGRELGEGQPKYLNSAQTTYFQKGTALYGVAPGEPLASTYDHLVVAEGYTDALAINAHTNHQALSPMGTALTKAHAAQLARLTELVYLCFDGDTSGATTALKAAERLLAHRSIEIRMVELPPGEDPASLITSQGGEAFAALLEHHEPPFVFAVRHAINQADLDTPQGRDSLVDQLAPLFDAAPAGPLRQHQLELAAAAAELPLDELRLALTQRS